MASLLDMPNSTVESRNGQQLTQSREKDSVGPRGGQLLVFFSEGEMQGVNYPDVYEKNG